MTTVNHNFLDDSGNPDGGTSYGHGFTISWQKGPLVLGERNGAFVEEVLDSVIKRIEFYQDSKFNCQENQTALENLYRAKLALNERTARRSAQGVEGTHEGN